MVNKTINDFALEEGYDLILYKDVAFVSDEVDITQKIIEDLAVDFIDIKGSMFLGRGLSYPVALEGALKFKELTYLHAEGYPAGEMKHGPIALIEDELPVIMFLIADGLEDKSISNLQEAHSRGAKIIFADSRKDHPGIDEASIESLITPKTKAIIPVRVV